MTQYGRRSALTLALATVCVLLAALLVQVWTPAGGPIAATASAGAVRPLPEAATPVVLNRQAYEIIAERPIVQPERRPYALPAVAAPAPPPAPPPPPPAIRAYTVVGVVVSGDRRLAWVKAPSASSTARIAEGDVIQGWRVKRITPEHVTFEAGAAETILEFKRRSAASASEGRR